MGKRTKIQIDLNLITEDELLKARICDLPLKIEGAWFESCVKELYAELEEKGMRFRPLCYLADEWLTPDQEPVIGIPFFLAHPKLMKLEKKIMLDAEGETKEWFMKLLRHETGHTVNYAYKLFRRKKWQQLFGHFEQDYPDTYRFRPYSRSFVRHLEDYYAQYHPDEDFAETFAVWLNPQSDWPNAYKGWNALQKIKYADELMQAVKDKEPRVKFGKKYWQASNLTTTLENYYKRKRRYYAEDFLDFHDTNLKKIFAEKDESSPSLPAAYLMIKKYRKEIIKSVSRWTGEKKHIIDGLLKSLIKRCKELHLGIPDTESLAMLKISAYITTLMMNYMYTGRLKGKK
ncbi:MAG: putative zinc-binding metallopeptidase [Candidatus Omnitrophica bacterium]|nr:putative zinc-binding metallopeptidase [Candidatus Omnitrophota bacterium]MBU1925287.1 putative zinc-binding metallopeptidase [Candidatus Omnitrophota bacterium]